MTKVPITVNGAQKLRDEFQRLKKEDRPRIVSAIAEARAHGDLRENAEYHAAKEEQGFIEARIKQIDGMLSNAEIIDVTALTKTGKVVFGATVELIDEDSGKQVAYQIVGEDEADIGSGMLSFSSPIARALIGREEGDVVEVKTPGGDRSYEIVEVRYS
ncbi:MAG: transcription elongation factor GreA [Gammaproteobacteria bacterium]